MEKISSPKHHHHHNTQNLCNVAKQTGYKNVNTQSDLDPNSLQTHFPDAKLEKKKSIICYLSVLSLSCRLQLCIFQVSYNKGIVTLIIRWEEGAGVRKGKPSFYVLKVILHLEGILQFE